MTALLSSVAVGSQQPRILSVPPHRSSAGAEAVELAREAGVLLDPWQVLVLESALAESRPGKWAAREVGLVVSRQNGKGEILLARELAGLFLFGDQLVVHTAHEFKTAADAYRRIKQVIESTPDLDRLVSRMMNSHGDEGIELKNGSRLRFFARTGGSGRGFSGDVIVVDEAYNAPEQVIAALLPTMATRPNPQLWYASTAVDQQSPAHQNGRVLSRVRSRGLRGDDPSLVYLEWSADEDEYRDDRGRVDFERMVGDDRAVAAANPALGVPGHGIPLDHVAWERRSMSPRTFAVERLSVGDWPSDDPDVDAVINRDAWLSTVDAGSSALDPVAFAVDMNPERTWVSVGVAGRRADGLAHVEVAAREAGTSWVVPWLRERVQTWEPCAVALDPGSPAGSLLPSIAEANKQLAEQGLRLIEVLEVSGRQMAQACGEFYDAATRDGGSLRHLNDPVLAEAVSAGRKRSVGSEGAWSWDRRDFSADISPLVAVTLALHAFAVRGQDREPEPFAFFDE